MFSGYHVRRRSRLGSWGREADPTDVDLRKEREEAAVPWSKSPFPRYTGGSGAVFSPLSTSESSSINDLKAQNALKVEVSEEVEWIDLLLELAMTTAFANLADNTPLLSGKEASSYIAFFALVWWIWASQVAYNMRFRQADWFHRTCAFLQLVVLCGMAAFTSDFDITVGLFRDRTTEAQRELQRQALGITTSQQQAMENRLARLPRLNARGIAAVMGCSRLLMLVQYSVVLWYARHIGRRSAIIYHSASLVLSCLLFFASFIVLKDTTTYTSIAKLALWYSAIAIELAVHFAANKVKGHVSYSSDAVYGRSSTLFVVVLGIGLDKVTNQFQFVVGAAGFDKGSVGVMISIAVIIIGLFALYFGTGKTMVVGDNKKLGYFFGHFPFMTAVIVVLGGVSTLLGFSNLSNGVNELFTLLYKLPIPEPGHPELCDVNSLTANLTDAKQVFWQAGLSFPDWIGNFSSDLCMPVAFITKDNQTASKAEEAIIPFLQLILEPIVFLFEQFEALPEPDSNLYATIKNFQTSKDPNVTNIPKFAEVLSDMLIFRLTPSLWFMAAGGMAVIMMGVLTLIRQVPRDKWEWGAVMTRLIGGTAYAMLSLFNLNSGQALLIGHDDGSFEETTSIIWRFAQTDWILPSYALLLIVLNLISFILNWLARRSYRQSEPDISLDVLGEQQGQQPFSPMYTQTPVSTSSSTLLREKPSASTLRSSETL